MVKIFSRSSPNLQKDDSSKKAIESYRFNIATAIGIAGLVIPTAIWWFTDGNPYSMVVNKFDSVAIEQIDGRTIRSKKTNYQIYLDKISNDNKEILDIFTELDSNIDYNNSLTKNSSNGNYYINQQAKYKNKFDIFEKEVKTIDDLNSFFQKNNATVIWCKLHSINDLSDCRHKYHLNESKKIISSEIKKYRYADFRFALPLTAKMRDSIIFAILLDEKDDQTNQSDQLNILSKIEIGMDESQINTILLDEKNDKYIFNRRKSLENLNDESLIDKFGNRKMTKSMYGGFNIRDKILDFILDNENDDSAKKYRKEKLNNSSDYEILIELSKYLPNIQENMKK